MRSFLLLLILYSCSLFPQTRWQKLNGPTGAGLNEIYSKGDTIVVGSGQIGKIFFSFNNGQKWNSSKLKLNSPVTEIIYNDSMFFAAVSENGIYKSIDLIDWIKIKNGNFLSFGKDYKNQIYCGAKDGSIFITSDNGRNWIKNYSGNGSWINNFLSTNSKYIFASGSYQLLRKNIDTSSSWEPLNIDTYVNDVILFNDSLGNIYFFNKDKIFKSTDNGDNWTTTGPNSFFWNNTVYDLKIKNKRFFASMGDETGWFGNGWGIAFTDDAGISWQYSNIGLEPKYLVSSSLSVDNKEYILLSTGYAGMFKSTDNGDSWFRINNGIAAAYTVDICFDSKGVLYSSNWSNGIQKSSDKGANWEVINNGLTNSYCLSILSDNNDILFAGTEDGIFRSSDDGNTWHRTAVAGNDYGYHLFKDKQNRVYSLCVGSGLYRTTDLGDSWQKINTGFISERVFSLAFDSLENMYAGTDGNAIYKSTNDGVNWQIIKGDDNSYNYIEKLAVAPNGYIFAATDNEGILRSRDNGQTWENLNTGLSWKKVSSLGIDKNGKIYTTLRVNTSSLEGEKVLYSENYGDTWLDYTSNFNLMTFHNIIFDNEFNVYFATEESVWRNNPDSTVNLKETEKVPSNFNLSQNYPNPFNPSTIIKYSVAGNSQVSIKLYDVLGNLIKILVDEHKSTGEYEIEFKADNILPSGIYFYELKSGTYRETKKMLLLK